MKYSIILAALLFAACSGTTEPRQSPISGRWIRAALTTNIPMDSTVTVNGNFTGSPSVSTSPDSLFFSRDGETCYVWQSGVVKSVTAKVSKTSVSIPTIQLAIHGDTLVSSGVEFAAIPAVYVRH